MQVEQARTGRIVGLAQCCAQKAGQALSRLVRSEIAVHVLRAGMVPIPEVSCWLGEAADEAVGLYCRVEGEVQGCCTLLLSAADAEQLTAVLLNRACSGAPDVIACESDEVLRRSALEETANIVVASFLNGMAQSLNVLVVPGVPQFANDMYGAIVDAMVLPAAQEADQVLVMKTALSRGGKNAQAVLLFVPDSESLRRMEGRMHGW